MFLIGSIYKLHAAAAVWIDSPILEIRARDYWLQSDDLLCILGIQKGYYVVQTHI